VLLLDEIEKAHEDLFNILLQVLDHATLTDNNGKKADFRNVIVMMTSNAGSREMSSATIGFGDPKSDSTGKGQKAIEKIFSPEFRNRLDGIITFNALDREIMAADRRQVHEGVCRSAGGQESCHGIHGEGENLSGPERP
jgi:ATP-dependent Clp protease ATP-binding subunit ClpA